MDGIAVVCILIILYTWYIFRNAEGYGDPKWVLPYPPHVRVTRAGVKYYDRPYSHNLRKQLNVAIVPPSVAASGAVGAVPIVQPPPPSQKQVDEYPAGSGSVSVPDLSGEPVAVKTAEPANKGKDIISKMNGGSDEVESYL